MLETGHQPELAFELLLECLGMEAIFGDNLTCNVSEGWPMEGELDLEEAPAAEIGAELVRTN